MRALVVDKSARRFAAAKVLGATSIKAAVEYGPLSLKDISATPLPDDDWIRLSPRLSGICGSDISSLTLHTSRYFEDLTSFPLTPGHEIVADHTDSTGAIRRVVIEPALTCVVRGLELCRSCRVGETQRCESILAGTLKEGIQLGYCRSTGGGWAQEFVAHPSQVWEVPSDLDDDDAVMIEPLACAVHAALRVRPEPGARVALLGAGTVGLTTLAAIKALFPQVTVAVGAKYPVQKAAAQRLGADTVTAPEELLRHVRRNSSSMASGRWMSSGFDYVYDCVGSASSLEESTLMARPGGTVVVVGMPGKTSLDLAPLWHREITMTGSYAYGEEILSSDLLERVDLEPSVVTQDGNASRVRTFALALGLMRSLRIGWMVTHHFAIDDYAQAIDRAAAAGRLDAIKVTFDLRRKAKSADERTR